MANVKKKAAETAMVMVDAAKLSTALKTTFEGVAMVFESIGVETDMEILKKAPVDKKETAEEITDTVEETGATEHTDTSPAAPETDAGDAAPEQERTQKPEQEQKPEQTADKAEAAKSSVTQDDITKMIFKKIKQNRSNNEKIGQILKAYGVQKVSDLPEPKYEAFLTDISEI